MKLQVTTQPLFWALCSKVAGRVCYEIFILRTDLSHFPAPLSCFNAILNNKKINKKNSGVIVADIKQTAKWLLNSSYFFFISWLVVFSGFSPYFILGIRSKNLFSLNSTKIFYPDKYGISESHFDIKMVT